MPRGQTQFAEEVSDPTFTKVESIASETDSGQVVILCFKSDEEWTAIGTRKIFGVSNGVRAETAYATISDITSRDYPPPDWKEVGFKKLGALKQEWEFLAVTDNNSQCFDFWVLPAEEAFAIWNVLMMLWQMNGSTEE